MGAMWESSKQSISAGDHSVNLNAGGNIYLNSGNIPTELVDDKIKEEVEKLKKSRFFIEFDSHTSSLRLGGRLIDGDLTGGSKEIKCRALAWCARLSCLKELRRAEAFLELAITLGDYPEAKIAESFIFSQKGDKAAALRALTDFDSGASLSASLMTVAHHEGAEGSLRWMNDAGYTVGNLDSDGKSFLLSCQLQLSRWDEIVQTVGAISENDFEDTPILHHLVALASLVPNVPQDFRAIVLKQIPFEAEGFPLASDSVAMNARRAAHKHFIKGFEAATLLSCPRTARIDDEYALWLELLDPDMAADGKKRLESKLLNPDTELGVVHYALQFGIKLDIDRVEREIDREIARNGGITMEAAIARFALAFTKPTTEEAAHYIARHHNQLAAHIDSKVMQFRQIEMFSRADLIQQANDILGQLIQQGITDEEEKNLRWMISEAQGNNHIESRKAQYRSNGGLDALINLVVELEKHQHWDELCEFGRLLFDETHYLRDAERLVNALNNSHRSAELVNFLKDNVDLLSQSKHLHISYAWGLYHEGVFLESRAELKKLCDETSSPNYRALQVNLGIATGDWDSLSAYIADEYRNRGDRSSHDLIAAAQLALHLGLPQAKDLVFEAAAKANDDSSILTAAYFIATSAGWEKDPQVFQWLEKAVELSGDDGPLHRMSLKDLFDRKPEWDRRESETWRLLAQGKIPIFVAAESLNRTLIDLTIFPALANLTETDPRRRSAIPAYSGKRVSLEFDVVGKTVALDATALLTLSFLNILDLVLDAFDAVYFPHSTLGWLFEERQKTTFHQPSRIANAHKVRDLLATNVLEEFMPSSVASSDLSAQIGDDLAALIAEAEKLQYADGIQHIVVRSAPVHRLSSLMAEEADLSAHAAILSSCLAVVEKLRQKGQLTAQEEKRARAYLQLHEKPWPNQPDIADGATLYLDDLAITYFQHLGLLGKLKAAGLKAVVSQREVSETDALISYERTSEEVKDVIERIRTSLNSRIESGRARVNRRRNYDEVEEKAMLEHPTIDIIAIASYCDAVIVDDRFINQHENIDTGGNLIPILSTLDLLDVLAGTGIISDEDRLEHRTRLRRAGFFFIPVSVEELYRCLRESTVDKGKVIETAELKAIRESVLRIRMSDWLQIQEEAPWLDRTLKAFVNALRKLWVDGADIEDVTARSNWLAEQIDVRGWAHRLVPENADNVIRIGRATHILLLVTPPTGVHQSIVGAYWNWVEERILAPIHEQFPAIYEWLVDWHRNQIAEMADTQFSLEDDL
ncbi:MAG: hypothetical protein Q8N35_17110 [Methylococcaceae bacterium]|nr:hypothetical protein [Methylococcaceae bacterium]MDZ4157927.1 hypothetical protein [Methylococcales bacterium]MDP2393433.1 hypothetical protein [Methylococcaceae bacterium]MDP3021303.1 hypothetical protein [Methylococcaceae bacterium]MDP3392025.1 hypothetical protein [Methylococcaceae bacterium]